MIQLGEERKAARLFLESRTAAQKYSRKNLVMEGDLVRHNQKFCRIFFDHIYETTKEFNHDFENKADSFSSLVVWVQAELKAFVEQFANQVFVGNTDLLEQAECISAALSGSMKLSDMGLDVEFLLAHLMRRHIVEAIINHRKLIADGTQWKHSNEEWRPLNLQTPTALEKLKEEMSALNLTTFNQYCKDPCFVRLTPTMISFARLCIPHTQAAMKLYSQELYHPIVDSITELLRSVTQSITKSMTEVKDQEKVKLVRRSAKFLASDLIPAVNKIIKEKTGKDPRSIQELLRNFLQSFPS